MKYIIVFVFLVNICFGHQERPEYPKVVKDIGKNNLGHWHIDIWETYQKLKENPKYWKPYIVNGGIYNNLGIQTGSGLIFEKDQAYFKSKYEKSPLKFIKELIKGKKYIVDYTFESVGQKRIATLELEFSKEVIYFRQMRRYEILFVFRRKFKSEDENQRVVMKAVNDSMQDAIFTEDPVYQFRRKRLENAIQLIKKDPKKANYITHTNDTPLKEACRKGNMVFIKFLIKNGAKLNLNIEGPSVLHCALYNGKTVDQKFEIAKYLLELGVDINGYPKNGRGRTPLMVALRYKDEKIIEYLMSKGADLTIINSWKEDAFTAACRYGNSKKILDLFRNKNYQIKMMEDKWGKNAADLAIERGYEHIIDALIEYDIDLSKPKKDGSNVINTAVKYEKFKIAKKIIEKYPDINLNAKKNGESIIQTSIKKGNDEFIKYLLGKGVKRPRREVEGQINK